ncbi:MAG: DUF3782 domain-containing protein [Chloroflexi bacterium]|nr:DUF3782 domain-containing protein [Chloroflexota bacterium]
MTNEQANEPMAKAWAAIEQLSREFEREHALTEKAIREVNKQIGGLANKFGSFTEGLARTSLARILRQLGMDVIIPHAKVHKGSRNEEYDMLGWSNGQKQEVILVEIKSNLDERDLQQTLRKLKQFFTFMPEHKGKTLRGLIAAVDLPEAMSRRAAQLGLYLAQASDENFKLVPPPKGFKPAAF